MFMIQEIGLILKSLEISFANIGFTENSITLFRIFKNLIWRLCYDFAFNLCSLKNKNRNKRI